MEYKAVMFTPQDKNHVRSFLRFPASLYLKNELMQDAKTEAEILSGQHILSRCFSASMPRSRSPRAAS